MLRILSIATLILSFFALQPANGCSCIGNIPLSESYSATNLIFAGKAVQVTVDQANQRLKILFHIQKVYKGNCSLKQVIIYTNTNSAACGLPIKQGEVWQIWAQKFNGEFNVNLCGRSTKSINSNVDFLCQQCKRKVLRY